MSQAPFLHRKTIIISVVVFGVFLFITQPLYRLFLMPTQQFTDKPAYQLYNALAQSDRSTRTLLVFANHAEQRVGGGFVGSVGVLQGGNNTLRLESVRSIYYYDHRLEEKRPFVEPPAYLKNLTSSLVARDSLVATVSDENAQLFRDLYARETGEYINNVVIITPKVLSLLLTYTGPIELPEYSMTITSDNILSTLQEEVEAGQDKIAGKDPKTVLKVLAQKLMGKIPQFTLAQTGQLSDDVVGLMQTQQLYAYLEDETAMKKLDAYQAPLAKPGGLNTVQLAAANHAANKSSQAIAQSVKYVLRIDEAGEARLAVRVTRQHQRDYTGYYIDPKSGQGNFIIGDDLSWIQLSLPAGTTDVLPDGFGEQGDTGVFGVDVATKPLTTSTVTDEFVLPTRYAMLDEVVVDQSLLAQFGWFGQKVDFTVEVPAGYAFTSGSDGVSGVENNANRQFFQIDDENLRFVFTKK
ncbi:MAG: hypothetical protein QG658_350 [Patescibacteria group bacterium]|nr:hypothetical protein [Patescibacteria group bacterium]